VKKFNKFLKSLSGLTSESQYQNHEQTIEENIEFSGLSKEEKQQLFQEYVQSLKMEDEGQISEGERDKSKKKKAKKKKKTHRRDSSEEDGYSSEASRHRSESKSRSRSRSKERKKRKEK
jgi:FF domain.